ncbi:MAG: hypothetical protein HY720_13615 [Planctomycetes bacterium]|nr:hypothetical protein [Planctomycetota bacterium]
MLRSLVFSVALVLALAANANACAASYVHGIGQSNMQSDPGGSASQVADAYMLAKGCDPNSPAGQVVKPYVVGTTVVDGEYPGGTPTRGRPGGDTIDACVQSALDCYHHEAHYGDGAREAGFDPNGMPSTTLGG